MRDVFEHTTSQCLCLVREGDDDYAFMNAHFDRRGVKFSVHGECSLDREDSKI